MKKRKSFKRRVFETTTKETVGSIRTALYTVASAIVVTVARLYILGRNSATNYFQEFIVDFVITGLLFTVVWFIFYLIFIAPYKVGKELDEYTKELEDKSDPDKVKLPIIPSPDNYLPIGRVDIFIHNPTNEEITDCQIMLKNLYWRTEEYGDSPENVSFSNRLFERGEYFRGSNKDVIGANTFALVQIAEVQKDQMVFLLKEPFPISELHYEKSTGIEITRHLLEIDVIGKLKNSTIRSSARLVTLHQKGMTDFRFVKILDTPRTSYVESVSIIHIGIEEKEQEAINQTNNPS